MASKLCWSRPETALSMTDMELDSDNYGRYTPYIEGQDSDSYRGNTPISMVDFNVDISHNIDGRATPDTHSLQHLIQAKTKPNVKNILMITVAVAVVVILSLVIALAVTTWKNKKDDASNPAAGNNADHGCNNWTYDKHIDESTFAEQETLESSSRVVSREVTSNGVDINIEEAGYESLCSDRNDNLYNTINDDTYTNINDVQVGSLSFAESGSVSSRTQLTETQTRKKCLTDCKKCCTKKCMIVSLTITALTIVILVLLVFMLNKDIENGLVIEDGNILSNETTSQSSAITGGVTTTSDTTAESTKTITSTTTTAATPTTTTTSTTISTSTTTPATTPALPGTWTDWNSWTQCDVTCGSGVNVRYRSCSKTSPTSAECQGNYVEKQVCTTGYCPTHGKWERWSSWGSCDAACGGGQQSRGRSCITTSSSDIDCVGDEQQQKVCSDWACSDCSQTCTVGTLNAECDVCECSITITGTVSASNNAPIKGAFIYAEGTLTNELGQTASLGEFTLSTMCLNANITVTKDGFQKQTLELISSEMTIILQLTEFPKFTIEPEAKARLEGESIKLCCTAVGIPDISSYEWFKDSILLNKGLYTNGTELIVETLSASDSGLYCCRANNDVGATESVIVSVEVKDSPQSFCEDALEQRRIYLPEDCIQSDTNTNTFEVGECTPRLCRQLNETQSELCKDNSPSCCGIRDFEIVSVQCTGYKLSLVAITACGCASCSLTNVKIIGTGLMYGSETDYTKFYQVYLNGVFKSYVNFQGSFNVLADDNISRAVLTIRDSSQTYKSTTKVIDLSEQSTGTLYTTLHVVDFTGITSIDSLIENTIFVGPDPISAASSVAEIRIPASSFLTAEKVIYTGTSTVKIGFLDALNVNDFDIIPGLMLTVDSDGNEISISSLAAFWITFENSDSSSSLLLSNDITINIPNTESDTQYSLFQLDISTGMWFSVGSLSSANEIGTLDGTILNNWFIVGTIQSYDNICFFNAEMYESSNLKSEVAYSMDQFFMQMVHFDLKGRFETYGHTFSSSTTCFKTLCNGNDGYIEMWVSNYELQTDEYLYPANPSISSNIGLDETTRQWINYTIMDQADHLGIRFSSQDSGPFFTNEVSCLASIGSGQHFKFYFNNEIEDVYMFQPFFNDIPDGNQSSLQELSKRTWYPYRDEGYRLCYVKLEIVQDNSESIKVRTISYGGTNADISNEILGIQESNTVVSKSLCIEYKCSGSIDVSFSSSSYDYTKVNVQPSSSNFSCSVVSMSQSLLDSSNSLNFDQIGSNNLTFYPPIIYGPDYGLYSATSDSGDIALARTTAKGQCKSGDPSNTNDNNPSVGTAAVFSCMFT